jgi:hypothetical protein
MKKTGGSAAIECASRNKRYYNRGDTSTERQGTIILAGEVVKEQNICSYGKNEERGGEDYCWDADFYSKDSGCIANVFYNKSTRAFQASFRSSSVPPVYYNLKYFCGWENTPIIYCADKKIDREISWNYSKREKDILHLNVAPEFVEDMAMTLIRFEYIPPEMEALLKNIVETKKNYDECRAAFEGFYEYILGAEAKKYL